MGCCLRKIQRIYCVFANNCVFYGLGEHLTIKASKLFNEILTHFIPEKFNLKDSKLVEDRSGITPFSPGSASNEISCCASFDLESSRKLYISKFFETSKLAEIPPNVIVANEPVYSFSHAMPQVGPTSDGFLIEDCLSQKGSKVKETCNIPDVLQIELPYIDNSKKEKKSLNTESTKTDTQPTQISNNG